MYHSHSRGRDDSRSSRSHHVGRSPPRRRRSRSRSPGGGSSSNHFCMYCKVQVSSQRLYDEHCNSAVHKQKEIIITKAVSDGLQYCYTCEKIFPSKLALDAHCLMTRHKPLYRVDELQPAAAAPVLPVVKEKEPEVTTPTTPQAETESRRAREDKEREDILAKLKEVRGDEATESAKKSEVKTPTTPFVPIAPETNPNTPNGSKSTSENSEKNGENDERHVEKKDNFCYVCNVDCNSSSNYKIHQESWRHRSEVDKRKDEDRKKEKDEARKKFEEEANKAFDMAEEAERKKVPDNMSGKVTKYFCEVCSIASESESHYLEHLKARKHFRQVGSMRRPYKCYVCEMEFNVAKDFNYHLETAAHMDKAFKRGTSGKSEKRKTEKDDEWVEKKSSSRRERERSKERESRRDGKKDSRSSSRKEDSSSRKDDYNSPRKDERSRHSDKKDRSDSRSESKKDRNEVKDSPSKSGDSRKVEIVDTTTSDGPVKDLREKLQAKDHQKIIITKENSPTKAEEEQEDAEEVKDNPGTSNQPGSENPAEAEKLLEQYEVVFEAKFKELMEEFVNNKSGLQDKLARDREDDINAYQKYEDDFKELQEVEDFNRTNIDQLDDGNPRKEEFIIDIIRVQRKMEELRQQMEIKEMMIIKREVLYRKNFPENVDQAKGPEKPEANAVDPKKPVVYDYNHGKTSSEVTQNTSQSAPKGDTQRNREGEAGRSGETEKNNSKSNSDSTSDGLTPDLRIKLERERLLKRLGPELESVDASLREKLISVIMEKDQASDAVNSAKEKHNEKSKDSKSGDARSSSDSRKSKDDSRKKQMEQLTQREKQLEDELARLKKNAIESMKKKGNPKSLVPQYDDVDDKKKDSKKKARKRSMSLSSVSSETSSSSADSDISRAEKKMKKKRKRSPSKSRSKSSKSGPSGSSDRSRRRRRSSSRDRDRKKKSQSSKRSKDDDKRKKSERSKKDEKKKPVKMTVKSKEKPTKVIKTENPLGDENDSDDVQEVEGPPPQPITVIGVSSPSPSPQPSPNINPQDGMPSDIPYYNSGGPDPSLNLPLNAPAASLQQNEQFSAWKNSAQSKDDSPKEDIWDSAFSGSQEPEPVSSGVMNIFEPGAGASLPEDILNILRNVAPILNQQPKDTPKLPPVDVPPPPPGSVPTHLFAAAAAATSRSAEPPGLSDSPRPTEENMSRPRSILKNSSANNPGLYNNADYQMSSHPPSTLSGIPSSSADYSSPNSALGHRSGEQQSSNLPSEPPISRPNGIGRSILKRPLHPPTSLGNAPDDPYQDKVYPAGSTSESARYATEKDYANTRLPGDVIKQYDYSKRKPLNSSESTNNTANNTPPREEWPTNQAQRDIPPYANNSSYDDYPDTEYSGPRLPNSSHANDISGGYPRNEVPPRHLPPVRRDINPEVLARQENIYGKVDPYKQAAPAPGRVAAPPPAGYTAGVPPPPVRRGPPPAAGREELYYSTERPPRADPYSAPPADPYVNKDITPRGGDIYGDQRDPRNPREPRVTDPRIDPRGVAPGVKRAPLPAAPIPSAPLSVATVPAGELKQPVRFPGETDDEYYARFERFYEMQRRKERETGADTFPTKANFLPNKDPRINPRDDPRIPNPPRVNQREDLYRPSDRLPPPSSQYPNDSYISKPINKPPPMEDRYGAYRRPAADVGRGFNDYKDNGYPVKDPRNHAPQPPPPQVANRRLPLNQPPQGQPKPQSMLPDFQDY